MDFCKEDYDVRSIPYSEAKEWVLYKHYAHRIPPISFAFGLYSKGGGGILQGVCTFGPPASNDLILGAVGEGYTGKFLELNRLVVNDGLPRNALSFFVSRSLNALPTPMVVISYADSGMGHHGYIYQATNWVYTGLSKPHVDYLPEDNTGMHVRSLYAGGNFHVATSDVKLVKVERSRKHRYFKFLGDKRQVRAMMKDLKFPIVSEYPKGDNTRYDASYQPSPCGILF